MASTITLTVSKNSGHPDFPEFSACTVKIVVDSTTGGIPKEIFIFQRDVDSEFSPEKEFFFHSVAGLADFNNIPTAISLLPELPFFRSSELELVYENEEDADTLVRKVKQQISLLQGAYDQSLDPENTVNASYVVEDGVFTPIEAP
jgi:hypothetical protein